MATASFVPVEVYLKTLNYEPDAEYVDGVIQERPAGEDSHSAWQDAIAAWFRMHAKEWGIRSRPELRVQVGPTKYLVPDVTILDRNVTLQPVAVEPPVAVFEVLSPDDRIPRMLRKLNDYAGMGISQIWVIDPDSGESFRFEDRQLVPRNRFSHPEKAIDFSIQEIAALVDIN